MNKFTSHSSRFKNNAVEQTINQLSGMSGNLWRIKEKHLKDMLRFRLQVQGCKKVSRHKNAELIIGTEKFGEVTEMK